MDQQVEVSASDIARIAGVRPSAVSNWRRRHEDFPAPVSGTDKNPRFNLSDVETWLRSQGKAPEIPAAERLWQAFESARGVMSTTGALATAGILLRYLSKHPKTPVPGSREELGRLMERAPHALVFGGGGVAAGLLDVLPPADLGAREATMLHAVAEAATESDPARIFEYLCSRVLDPGSRAGIAATPPDLAEMMLDLAAPGARRLLDPACGSGTILLAAAERGYTRVEGQEIDQALAIISALRLSFADSASFDVHSGDSLRVDAYQPGTADAVVCNPPFADRNWGQDEVSADLSRWPYGLPSRLESELAWVQHALWHVKPGGSVVMLMPPASAARPSGRRIRAGLLQAGALRAVISLPPRLAARYALSLQLWVLTRPVERGTSAPVLMVDASGFSAAGRTRTAGRTAETAPTWDEVRSLVRHAWAAVAFKHGSLEAVGDVAIVVPVSDLLVEEVDVTPARHLPSAPVTQVSRASLPKRRFQLQTLLASLPELLPDIPRPEASGGPAVRDVPLEELAQKGAVFIRRAAPQSAAEGREPRRVQGKILTGRDLARAVPPTKVAEIIDDEILNPRIQEGDVLVPHVARRLVARVAAGPDVGAHLSPSVVLIRPDAKTIDPWFLAGVLSSSNSERQAARMASTLGDHIRFEPRRVRVPLLPIEAQRAYGQTFRRLWDFTRTLRAAHDEGIDFVRDMIDATAQLTLDPNRHWALLAADCGQPPAWPRR